MTNNISNINNTAHNKNLDKTTFDEQPAYETRVSQAKKYCKVLRQMILKLIQILNLLV
ncbi:hypothetical protein ACJ6VM_24420 [Escherichia coli]|uniref:hypothetical protein n=1 Tax=Escherichia coli TaxID=562 RepID=UPI000F17613F|nr:hypothetical protein [Escherichia coli]VCV73086.1 hypothetical protein BANRA_00003 [Escherichia coli]VCV82098.1 hypothetical protein BANRA_05047 [Escherichia coli]VDA88759.1 hypothetical protein BANRA_02870 [Escherichia coli]